MLPDAVEGAPQWSPEAVRAADPRPARTRAAILAAVERMPSLPPEQVTVAAIARDAGVSRSAFYTQFTGLADLLSEVLGETAQHLGPDPLTSPAAPTAAGRRDLVQASLTRLVAHVEGRLTFYRAAYSWKIPLAVHDAAQEAYAEQIRRLIAAVRSSAPDDPRVPPSSATDLAATFVAGALIAVLTAWLRTDRAIPSADLIDQLLGLLPEWLTEETPTTEGR
jgi:AcrR family transcriptional regulator